MGYSKYHFHLPESLLAKEPANPRDSARLFVYDTKTDSIQFDTFYNLDRYLPPDATLVLNETRVIASRISLVKKTGGKVTCLFLVNEKTNSSDVVRVMVDRKISVGDSLWLASTSRASKPMVTCTSHLSESVFEFRIHMSRDALLRILDKEGTMPIPLYLRHTSLSKETLIQRYQTIYAASKQSNIKSPMGSEEKLYSVAAPTAGLHFTERVFEKLKAKGIETTKVVLEVGLGTFAPLTAEALEQGKLHTEWYLVPERTRLIIQKQKRAGKPIFAVGTTVVRALESYGKELQQSRSSSSEYLQTDIFIEEGHPFQMIDGLITNFHLPDSSLIMLVAAFLKYKKAKRSIIDLYTIAIKERFRFYSFGDSMIIR